MPNLQAAHRGYEYQDLLSASRLVDLVLGGRFCRQVSAAQVDVKHVGDDRFGDLTVITVDGRRDRTQFKHSDNDDRPLTIETLRPTDVTCGSIALWQQLLLTVMAGQQRC